MSFVVVIIVQLLSYVRLFVTPWTVAHQVPLSVGFPRQEYWSKLSFPSPEDLPDPGIKPMSLVSPALADKFFTSEPPGRPFYVLGTSQISSLAWIPTASILNKAMSFSPMIYCKILLSSLALVVPQPTIYFPDSDLSKMQIKSCLFSSPLFLRQNQALDHGVQDASLTEFDWTLHPCFSPYYLHINSLCLSLYTLAYISKAQFL